MYLQRMLQINMATMAALATLLLGMGQRDATLPLVMFLLAMASVWLTDVTGWFRLNQTLAAVVAVAAVVIQLRNLSDLEGMTRILFIARLLPYLQVILLFQQKGTREYWALAVVGLLQVVVSAVFNQGVLFGVLLVVYFAVAISALALFFLHRERLAYQPPAAGPEPAADAGLRWPLAVQAAEFFGSAASARAALDRELFRRLGTLGAATLLLTVLLFFTVPRVGGTAWRGATIDPRHAVGFSDQVTLGELGEIIQRPDEVMRVRFSNLDGTPYPVQGTIYLRGAVLRHYGNGRWSYRPGPNSRRIARLDVTNLLTLEGLIRQEITIEPLDREELFCVWPFAKTESGGDLLIDQGCHRLLRPSRMCSSRFTFELKTPAFDRGVQVPLAPLAATEDLTIQTRPLLQMPERDGQSAVPGLVALAGQWIAESGLPPEDRAGRARLLEQRLRDSERFQYSLHGQERDLSLDPIEDFITNTPRGHCEYFATALTLMLRSQGIPARMVLGYHGDEWNDAGRFFQVRQWHAHAWVEAYLDPQHLPDALIRGEHHWDWAGGGWLRLDPTPGSPSGEAAAAEPWLSRAGRSFQSLWADYVMELDRSRQQEAIYQPVLDWIKQTARRLADPAWWREWLGNLGRAAAAMLLDWVGGDWLSWRGLVAVLILGLLLAAVVAGTRLLVRRVLARWARRAEATRRAQPARVEFYQRLETLLARRGLVRVPAQTQLEFALAAGTAIEQTTGQERLGGLPARVATAFYRVRFGGATLDNRQAQEVEQALAELEQATRHGEAASG